MLQGEIQIGAVAYFDHNVLLSDPEIDRDDDGLDRPGPFVCVQIKDGKSVWCAISSHARRERLVIADEWRRDGNQYWKDTPAYLIDGLCTYLGPSEAFVRAAAGERSFKPHLRPSITAEGIIAILAEIEKQGGPLLP